MRGYKVIRDNNDTLTILSPDELGFKSVTIVEPIKQVKEGVFQMNIMFI